MARPKKRGCDYFSHDSNMRNHRKIKALRQKFKHIGYSVWTMFLEHLTESENNYFLYNDLELELLSGDFDVTSQELRDIIDYCVVLGLLNNKGGYVWSTNLDERLVSVYAKRQSQGPDRSLIDPVSFRDGNSTPIENKTKNDQKNGFSHENSQKISNFGEDENLEKSSFRDENHSLRDSNTTLGVVIGVQSTQSKVKEIKEKEIENTISENSDFFDFSADQKILANKIRTSIKNLQKKNLIENLDEIEERFFPGRGTAFTVDKFVEYFFKCGNKFFNDKGTHTCFLGWERQLSIKKDSIDANEKKPLPPKSTPELESSMAEFSILEGAHEQIRRFAAQSKAKERKALITLLIDKYGIEKSVRKMFTFFYKHDQQVENFNTVEQFHEIEERIKFTDEEWEEMKIAREIKFKK